MRIILTILLISACTTGFAQRIIPAGEDHYAGNSDPFAELNLVDIKGNPVAMHQFKGKILYVGLWAASCGGSIAKFPYQQQLLKRLKEIGADSLIQLINIHVEDAHADWRKAVKKYQPIGVNLYCADTAILSKLGLAAPPSYILLDADGKLLAKAIYQPDEAGSIDYVLYAATKGIHPTDAIATHIEQGRLMAEQKTSAAITDAGYANWFKKTINSFVEFQSWRMEHMRKNTRN